VSSLYSAQPVNSSHLPLSHVTNVHNTVEQCTIRSTKCISNGDTMSSCGPIFMGGNFNGTVKQCKDKEQSIYRPSSHVLCDTQLVYIVLHVSTQRCHPQGLIIAKVYNQHNNVCSTSPYKVLIYVTKRCTTH
jgi:hypothetical protein